MIMIPEEHDRNRPLQEHVAACRLMKPETTEPSSRQIRRILQRSRLALAMLVGLWLAICTFVLLALWLRWDF
jgi:hypothetical protein